MGLRYQPNSYKPNGKGLTPTKLYWDGNDSPIYKIHELAEAFCADGFSLLMDILSRDENFAAVQYVWEEFGEEFVEKYNDKARDSKRLKEVYGDLLDDGAKAGGLKSKKPAGMKLDTEALGLIFCWNKGAKWSDWEIDLEEVGGVLCAINIGDYELELCSESHSVLLAKSTEVDRYQEVVNDLSPHIQKLERQIRIYEQAAKEWAECDSRGSSALTAIAAMGMFERFTDIYSAQDEDAAELSAMAKEIGLSCQKEFQRDFYWRTSTKESLEAMRDLYFDPELNKSLHEYLLEWNPINHYYFHAAASKAIGKSGFDETVFNVISMAVQYLSVDPWDCAGLNAANQPWSQKSPIGYDFATEANDTFSLLWKDFGTLSGDDNGIASHIKDRDSGDFFQIQRNAKNYYAQHFEGSERPTGILTTLSIWSAHFFTWVGNFEGPPSVVSLLLLDFAKGNTFLEILKGDTLFKAVLLIGVEPLERQAIGGLFRENMSESDKKATREIFSKGHWRSPAVFKFSGLIQLALFVMRADELIEKYEEERNGTFLSKELQELYWKTVPEVVNLGLIYFTHTYAKELNAVMTENIGAKGEDYLKSIARIDARKWRIIATSTLRVALGGITFGLSAWEAHEQWDESDNVERFFLAGLSVSALLTVASVLVKPLSGLGPVGFVSSLVITACIEKYKEWRKSGFRATVVKLLEVVQETEFFKQHKGLVLSVDPAFASFEWKANTTLEEALDELNDAFQWPTWDQPTSEHAYRYSRAGAEFQALCMMYEMKEGPMKDLLRKQRGEAYKRKKSRKKTEYEVVLKKPNSTAIPLYVDQLIQFEFIVKNHISVRHILMEWIDTVPGTGDSVDPSVVLSTGSETLGNAKGRYKHVNTYDPVNKVIKLHRVRKTKNIQRFAGGFKLTTMPTYVSSETGRISTPLYLHVPTEKIRGRMDWGNLQNIKARRILFEFPVELLDD